MKTSLECSHREFRYFSTGNPSIRAILPVIVTDSGILIQFAKYMHLSRFRSRSWQDLSTFAVQLLLEFVDKAQHLYQQPHEMFAAFADALYLGTIEDGFDASGLWWHPRRPKSANRLITSITLYTDWLAAVNNTENLKLNPLRQASRHEQKLNWVALRHRTDNALLSHLWKGNEGINTSRWVRIIPLADAPNVAVKAFPEESIGLLLHAGFKRKARDGLAPIDIRNVLITLLMHYGGLRLSEALSIWSSDVTIEDGEVVVRIYNPQSGLAPDNTIRSIHLQTEYKLKPRNTLVKATDPLYLGWKNCLITDPVRDCFEVFFHPHETSVVFSRLWRTYHFSQRVAPALGKEHPYAFTSQTGQPYSHKMFRKAHKLGIARIGLEYGKLRGTTPHGHRHAYGQALAADGAGPILIKTAMHHASISSSQVYTQPGPKKIREMLSSIDSKLAEDVKNILQIDLNE